MSSYVYYKYEDYVGKQYGSMYVIAESQRDKRNKPQLLMKCSKCNSEKVISVANLKKRGEVNCICKSKHHFLNGLIRNVCGIYKIENPHGEIYIGQSRDMRVRWRGYTERREYLKENNIHLSLLKHGVENHNFSIIHQLPNDVTNEILWNYEELYIQLYIDCNVNLLNIRAGGFSNKHLPESIEKMKGKVGKWMLGRKIPKNVIAKGVATRKLNNKPISDESRQKYIKQQLGSNNTMAKLSEKEVLEIVELRKTLKVKYSDLAKKFGVSVSGIANIFNGHNWTHITKINK